MKLFIFKPCRFWAYCGGMLIVTAPDYTEACQRLQDKENKTTLPTTLKFTQTDLAKEPRDCSDVDLWVLFQTIEVPENTPSLCEIEYNYA
jgi:hypothetical protein